MAIREFQKGLFLPKQTTKIFYVCALGKKLLCMLKFFIKKIDLNAAGGKKLEKEQS